MKRKSTKRATHKRRKVIRNAALAKEIDRLMIVQNDQALRIGDLESQRRNLESTLKLVFESLGTVSMKAQKAQAAVDHLQKQQVAAAEARDKRRRR